MNPAAPVAPPSQPNPAATPPRPPPIFRFPHGPPAAGARRLGAACAASAAGAGSLLSGAHGGKPHPGVHGMHGTHDRADKHSGQSVQQAMLPMAGRGSTGSTRVPALLLQRPPGLIGQMVVLTARRCRAFGWAAAPRLHCVGYSRLLCRAAVHPHRVGAALWWPGPRLCARGVPVRAACMPALTS